VGLRPGACAGAGLGDRRAAVEAALPDVLGAALLCEAVHLRQLRKPYQRPRFSAAAQSNSISNSFIYSPSVPVHLTLMYGTDGSTTVMSPESSTRVNAFSVP
jgi:hypothetical protein